MYTNPTGNAAATSASQGTTGTRSKSLGQDAFFELMVAQLQNQDPLKPMQNGEFLAQIAQFSTVNGIEELKNTVTDLASAMISSQALQASSLVGRNVLVESSTGALPADGSLTGKVVIPDGVDATQSTVKLTLTDASGAIVKEIDLGAAKAGQMDFSWDGTTTGGTKAAAGTYTIKAEVVTGSQTQQASTLVNAKVESVSLGGTSGIELYLAGIGATPLSAVRAIS